MFFSCHWEAAGRGERARSLESAKDKETDEREGVLFLEAPGEVIRKEMFCSLPFLEEL